MPKINRKKTLRKQQSKRKYLKTNKRKTNKRKYNKRKYNRRGGARHCPLHPAGITGMNATLETMAKPEGHFGEHHPSTPVVDQYWGHDLSGSNSLGVIP